MRGSHQNIDIPENSRHPQFILVFQVTAVAPLQHRSDNDVFPLFYKVGDIKFACRVAHLAVAHKGTVDPHIKTGIHTLII